MVSRLAHLLGRRDLLAGFVDSTVKEIESRLQELREEVSRLESALAALVGAATRRGPGRPRGSATPAPAQDSTARKPGRPRGRRSGGTRATQAVELVRDQPGITIPQIAEALKIEPNYLYRVMPKLVSEGQVRRDGQGWYPATSESE